MSAVERRWSSPYGRGTDENREGSARGVHEAPIVSRCDQRGQNARRRALCTVHKTAAASGRTVVVNWCEKGLCEAMRHRITGDARQILRHTGRWRTRVRPRHWRHITMLGATKGVGWGGRRSMGVAARKQQRQYERPGCEAASASHRPRASSAPPVRFPAHAGRRRLPTVGTKSKDLRRSQRWIGRMTVR